MIDRVQRGVWAEHQAAQFLIQAGFQILKRNYRSPYGEIDLIVQKDSLLCFVEVRYRARSDYGSAAESIHFFKQQRIQKTAQYYLQHNASLYYDAVRFDFIGISSNTHIDWIPDAF